MAAIIVYKGSLKLRIALVFIIYLLIGSYLSAQELEPRAYWVTPVASNAAYVIYSHSSGEFITDPTLPVEDVENSLNSIHAGYYRSIDFFGRSADVKLTVPFFWGTVEGKLDNQFYSMPKSGLADAEFCFSVNLLGAPAMRISDFQEYRRNPGTIIGASIRIKPPTGQYDSGNVINLGSNRWAFKPQVGLIHPVRNKFALELLAGFWMFTENKDFRGQTRKQDPLLGGEFHFIYRLRPGFWTSLDTTFFYGGRSMVGEEPRFDLQRHARIGGTVAIPFEGGHTLKFSANSGMFVSYGGDYTSFSFSYQYGWISGK